MSPLDSWHPSRPVDQYRVVIIDNYDSYAYNLYQRIGEITGRDSTVVRNDRVSAPMNSGPGANSRHHLPRPGRPGIPPTSASAPTSSGTSERRTAYPWGVPGSPGHWPRFRRTRRSRVARHAWQDEHGYPRPLPLFDGIEDRFTRWRSTPLVIAPDSVPSCLVVSAKTDDGTIMAVRHTSPSIIGVQFRPSPSARPWASASAQLPRNVDHALRARDLDSAPASTVPRL